MKPSNVLTLEDIREGLAAATAERLLMIRRGFERATFMAVCGMLPSGIAYLQGAPVTAWMFLLPAFLAAIAVPSPVREALHFSRMAAELKNAERKALAGELVQVSDVPSLGRRVAA